MPLESFIENSVLLQTATTLLSWEANKVHPHVDTEGSMAVKTKTEENNLCFRMI